MGPKAALKWRSISFICILFLNLASLVSGQLSWSGGNNQYLNVKENTAVGTVIGHVELNHPTAANLVISATNNNIKVNMTSNRAGFAEADILLNIQLDYESDPHIFDCYVLGRSGTDSTSKKLTISTMPVNEKPTLQNKPYSMNILENTTVGITVYQKIRAEDMDAGDRVTYTLIPSPQTKEKGKFIINSFTGDLTLTGPLDFETITFYQYTVKATDKTGLYDEASIFISVEDVQNKPPYFTGEPFVSSIPENSNKGTPLITVTATDGDRGFLNEVSLKIMNDTCGDIFEINETSGLVSTKSQVDREAKEFKNSGTCVLGILATEDSKYPQTENSTYTATTSITVTIVDVDDNAPAFSKPSYSATVDENTQPGVMIYFRTPITVTDIDQGSNAAFEVSVISHQDYFEATPTNGMSTGQIWIRVKNETILDYETHHNLTIEIEAVDSLNKSLRSTSSVAIIINNLNDNNPVFSNTSFIGSVLENSAPGTHIINITATDADKNDGSNQYGTVTYHLEGSDSSFEIDPKSGLLTVGSNKLDREEKDKYSFTVVATDGGGTKTSVPVEIKIIDKNDETPKFVTNYYQTSLKEEGVTLIPPIKVLAIDNDEKNTPNSEIHYTIVSAMPQGLEPHFGVDVSGTLSVGSPMIYENISWVSGFEGNITLTIEARDRGTTELNSTALVAVILQDINNNAPICTQLLYSSKVPENSAKHPVLVINATDADSTAPNNVIIYSIDQDSAEKFTISSTGMLSVRDTLDREETPFYNITVTVTDNGAQPRSGSCFVNVDVTDVNDVAPVFKQKSMKYNIMENTKGLLVQTNATDEDLDNVLAYSIDWPNCNAVDRLGQTIANTSVLQNWLGINSTTGEVTVVQPLDRETVLEFVLHIVVNDTKAVEKQPQTDTAIVTITLLDDNDEEPAFTYGSSYIASIQENMPNNSDIKFDKILEVSDADEGKNSEFMVLLLTFNTTFDINPKSGTSKQTFTISVSNSSALDYEVTQSFTLEVLAMDPTNSSMYSSATIVVNIINENDNVPEFVGSPYTASVPENSIAPTYVTTVTATDKDLNEYGKVTYSLPNNPKEFQVNSSTGEVFATEELDREKTPTYTVSVKASDIGNFASTTQLTIIVSDVNDNSPKFIVQQTSATISENMLSFSRPLLVKATDDDATGTNNSTLVYSLSSSKPSNVFNNFTIDNGTSEITLVSPLDYEELSPDGVIVLLVEAQDYGNPALSNSTSVTITVTDINDMSPHFSNPSYTTDILENSALGNIVFQVSAVDGDASSKNNKVRYTIDTLSGSTFSINETSGIITHKAKLDYETVKKYNILVTAMDNGQPVMSSTAVVNVSVTDVNDEKPLFGQKQIPVSGEENSNISYHCSATDNDLNKVLEYRIQWNVSSGRDGQGKNTVTEIELKKWIHIDTNTGEVTSLKTLDREQVSEFILHIVVEDVKAEESIPQTDTATLTITVLDVDDEKPVFTYGSSYRASIQENMPNNTDIKFDITLQVLDADEKEENSRFDVLLLTCNTTFDIYPKSGISKETFTISVLNSSALDYEVTQNFTLEVLAIDPTNSSMYSSATIVVNIINENDNFPEFAGGPYLASVPEDSINGTYIATVTATDKDLESYGKLTYSLDDSSKRFYIDSESGNVTLDAGPLDREDIDSYTITVKATDGGKYEKNTQLTIKVTDVNDKFPVFQQDPYTLEIKENTRALTIPLRVKAIDGDDPATNNSKISYRVGHVPTEIGVNPFTVNSDSGEVTLGSDAPDYETIFPLFHGATFKIEVLAIDAGIRPLNSTAVITVNILDTNDMTPSFPHSPYSGSVYEHSPEGVSVASVNATDDDGTSPNNDIYYVILSGSRDKLQINSTTGEISVGVGAILDRETTEKNGFELIVCAIDKGSPALTGTATVIIEVLDVNDSPPEIKPTIYTVLVYENATVGFTIASFNVTDKDDNPDLTFTLLWDKVRAFDEKEKDANISLAQDWLSINQTTGSITVKSEMDREQVERMILTVVVTDRNAVAAWGSQTDTATVTLSLSDVNDNPPIITSNGQELHLNVSEGTKLNTEVTTLVATDADKGQIITFSLENNSSSFHISDQGKLTLIKLLDRETEPHLSFYVIATDSGSPPMSSNITVIIDVLDINDYDPNFTTSETTFRVLENSTTSTWVARIAANDRDAGDNGNVTFDFKELFPPFRIDSITGDIYVSEKLDREVTPRHTLTVIAADNPLLESKRRSLLPITIEVLDVNDNSPEFESITGYKGSIEETASLGTVVTITPGQILATDKDEGNNSLIRYSIQAPNNFFSIDPISGVVRVNFNITDKTEDFSYVVFATDHGDSPKQTPTNLTITITDVNNHRPEFVDMGLIDPIPQCASTGQSVYTFNATDADKEPTTNGKVTYFMERSTANNDSQYFTINRDSGVLLTQSSSQYNFANVEKNVMKISVRAVDLGKPTPLSATTTLLITIIDTNDNPPEFDTSKTDFSVMEETIGRVANVKATDKDRDSELTYSFADNGDPWKDNFDVISDPVKGGIIYVNKSLDREKVDKIKLTLIVSDKPSNETYQICQDHKPNVNGHSATVEVVITVEDSNDNPPVFIEKSLSVGFLASTQYGEVITSLLAHVTDNDTAPYSVHKFYQVGEMEADSDIQKTWSTAIKRQPILVNANGTVVTNHKFVEDALGYFTMQVMANDSAGSDTTALKVYVVGESQVVHITVFGTEDELRTKKEFIVKALSDPDHTFVADNILPAYSKDGSVDDSKSVLIVHAVDRDGNIISGDTLVNFLDESPKSAAIQSKYGIYSTESGNQIGKSEPDNTDQRNLFILIGVIAVIAVTFVITLYLLIHTIRRFKRKLKAATLEVHGVTPIKQDTFPGLDNDNIKSKNPIFMRDDLKLDENYDLSIKDDTLSNYSENSLDLNAFNSVDVRDQVTSGTVEQEVTLDVYERDDTDHAESNLYPNLHLIQTERTEYDNSTNVVDRQRSLDVDIDENFDLSSYRNFESTDI